MVGIIPARGGSKGLPGKNKKELLGKPLIAYTIEAAKKAKDIDCVIVTTDSAEIAEISRQYGAEVPFIRPGYLAEDSASAVDVYLHAAEYMMNKKGIDMGKFMVLLPTAPLRQEREIDEASAQFGEFGKSTLISMTEASIPVSWYYKRDKDGKVRNAGFDSENAIQNRQVNETYFIPNGAIYILDYKLLKEKRTYYDENTIAYVMPEEISIDIDKLNDFQYVEYLMKQR